MLGASWSILDGWSSHLVYVDSGQSGSIDFVDFLKPDVTVRAANHWSTLNNVDWGISKQKVQFNVVNWSTEVVDHHAIVLASQRRQQVNNIERYVYRLLRSNWIGRQEGLHETDNLRTCIFSPSIYFCPYMYGQQIDRFFGHRPDELSHPYARDR